MWYLGYLASFLIAIALIREFAEPRMNMGIKSVIVVSWALGFSNFLVLPFDISNAFSRACDPSKYTCTSLPLDGIEVMGTLVPLSYTITILLGYLMNDLLISYLGSGEFSRRGRMKDALREIAIFYVPALVLGVILLVVALVMVPELQDFKVLRLLCRGLFNSIALFILIALLSNGLVEVPRDLWNRGNIEGLLKYYKFQVAVQSEQLQGARRKLEETLELVHQTDSQLRTEAKADQLREFMAAILRRCSTYELADGRQNTQPMQSASAGGTITPPTVPEDAELASGSHSGGRGGTSSTRGALGGVLGSTVRVSPFGASSGGGSGGGAKHQDEKLLPTTRKGLVALHLRLKRSLASEKRQRSMYELSVRRALCFQALFEPQATTAAPAVRDARGREMAMASSSAAPAEVSKWQGVVKPLLTRALAVLCAALSLTIIWCEGTILLDGPPFHLNLSPLSLLFRWIGLGGGGLFVTIALFIPLLYCAWCTYFAMFNMKLCEGYTLHPNKHSDASSLLFNATYACRFGYAICFNYLKLLHEGNAQGDSRFYQRTPEGETVKSYFSMTAFGEMDQLPPPFGGDYFNNYAPLVIVVLCGCTYLNLGSGLLSCCAKCFPCMAGAGEAFSFDEDFSDTRIDHGASILVEEKKALADGVPLGANLQLLSGATSDSEEAARTRNGARAPARSRFNRLQDEHL